MPFEPGATIDRYRLVAPIGDGGQASVWRVVDPQSPGDERALKLVDIVGRRPEDLERALREANLLKALRNPSLVTCHDCFKDERLGVVGLVLDWVDGYTLEQVVATRLLTLREREILLGHLLRALAYVHAEGVAHRDLTLRNVLVSKRFQELPYAPQTVKLIDFGIAVSASDARPLTKSGTIVGTWACTPPERLDPTFWRSPGDGMKADVFALGVLGAILLTERHPAGLAPNAAFADYVRTYANVAMSGARWPPFDIPGAWGPVLARCLSLDAAARPASCVEVARLLDAQGANNFTETHEAPRGPDASTSLERRPAGAPPGAAPPWAPPVASTLNHVATTGAIASMAHGTSSAARPSNRTPWAAVGAAGAFMLALASGGWWLLANSPTAPVSPSTTIVAPGKTAPVTRAEYAASTCAAPCCGGSACRSSVANTDAHANRCNPGDATCKPCNLPALTCIPGACTDTIQTGEHFALRLSHISYEKPGASAPTTRAACDEGLSICFRRHDDTARTCLGTEAVCGAAVAFPFVMTLTTEDVTRDGVDIEVRDRGGQTIATRHAAKYQYLQRPGLCSGLQFSAFQNVRGTVTSVGFFLEPI